jgi:hypothetical protein
MEEDDAEVSSLICHSPPGVPGASVQVYVKDGDKASSAQYFLYTFAAKPEKEVDDKVKVRTQLDDYTGNA